MQNNTPELNPDSQAEGETFFIAEDEAGERLDKILAKRLHSAGSRTYFQYLIDEGKVLVNGVPVKKRTKLVAGDEVEVEYVLTPELTLKPEDIPLEILYEDEHMMAINKPPGMVVHPAPGHWSGTFVNALLHHCRDAIINDNTLRPGIVHRLDKDTSGVLLAAKTLEAQKKLIEMFANRRINKEYLAVCHGNPGTGTVDAPIGRHPRIRQLMAIVPETGRQAITHHKSLGCHQMTSLVLMEIPTGRTHQIRVHMKHRGTPVLGDAVYGIPSLNEKHKIDRQMLHAYRVVFNHPITGKKMELSAPIPQDMIACIEKTGLFQFFRKI
jgi:23S rRNA pseudouridine1911/1915/1917 synthase